MVPLAHLTGARWPYVLPSDPTFLAQGLPAVLHWWRTQRLARCVEPWLSPEGRADIETRVDAVRISHRDGGGFEWVDGVRAGDPESLWALDMGCVAWAVGLDRLRREGLLPGVVEDDYLDAVQATWRADPARADAMLRVYLRGRSSDAPWAAWYWFALRLWSSEPFGDEDTELLDTVTATLHSSAARSLGVTAPLSLALALARQGQFEAAANMLDPEARRLGVMPPGPLALPEVTYHRSRYHWLAGNVERASRDLLALWRMRPSYVLRAVSDPIWASALADEQSPLATHIDGVVTALREAGGRWTRPSAEMARFPEAEELARLGAKAGRSFYDSFLLADPLARYDRWRHGVASLAPQLNADLESLRAFSDAIPDSLPLRLAVTEAPIFKSPVAEIPSDLVILKRTVNEGHPLAAATLARQLVAVIPTTTQLALSGYALRLLTALDSAVQVVLATSDTNTSFRLQSFERLIGECQDLAQQLAGLESETGAPLGRSAAEIWRRLQRVESAWVSSDQRAFGELDLRHVEGPGTLLRGNTAVVRLMVQDARGNPVGGVPVEWGVWRGPAQPVDRVEGVSTEWATSLDVGIALLRIRAVGMGREAHLRARVLGTAKFIDVRFEVLDRPDDRSA